jgi:hypothetical protein
MSPFEWLSAYGGWTFKTVVGVANSRPVACRQVTELKSTGLSEFLCARHTMTARSQYAETEEAGAAGKHP